MDCVWCYSGVIGENLMHTDIFQNDHSTCEQADLRGRSIDGNFLALHSVVVLDSEKADPRSHLRLSVSLGQKAEIHAG